MEERLVWHAEAEVAALRLVNSGLGEAPTANHDAGDREQPVVAAELHGATFEMKEAALHIVRFAHCVAVWFVVVLPMSLSIWRLYAMGPACFTPAWTSVGVEPVACLLGFAFFAPFAVIFGPIAHDEEEAPSELPEVLLTAALLALLSARADRDLTEGNDFARQRESGFEELSVEP